MVSLTHSRAKKTTCWGLSALPRCTYTLLVVHCFLLLSFVLFKSEVHIAHACSVNLFVFWTEVLLDYVCCTTSLADLIIYIYIYREREMYVLYIYIYIHTYIHICIYTIITYLYITPLRVHPRDSSGGMFCFCGFEYGIVFHTILRYAILQIYCIRSHCTVKYQSSLYYVRQCNAMMQDNYKTTLYILVSGGVPSPPEQTPGNRVKNL